MACPVFRIGHSRERPLRYYQPSVNRTYWTFRLEVDPVEEPTAVAILNEIIAGRKVGWVLEADLKNFFGSLDHEWVMRIVEHRVGDPRILNLIKRWLKADVLEEGVVHPNEEGTPQGGSISVLLSNLYLHYVLDLWFEKAIKPRMEG